MNIRDLASHLGASPVEFASGDEEITHVATIAEAGPGSVTFIANPSYEKFLLTTAATAVIVGTSLVIPAEDGNKKKAPALLRCADPYAAFAKTLALFNPRKNMFPEKIHPSAVISASASIASTAIIGAQCFIGDNVQVGDGSVIHPGAIIYDGTVIGKNVVIGAGTVIGFDGFGYAPGAEGSFSKIPQIGNVIIEDDVEIGANSTVDRGALNETRIRRGTKIDNLVHVGHNCDIGEDVILVALTGISGSSTVGNGAVLAGQVGIGDHVTIGPGVILGGQAGVFSGSKVTNEGLKPGTVLYGTPARPLRQVLREQATLARLAKKAKAGNRE